MSKIDSIVAKFPETEKMIQEMLARRVKGGYNALESLKFLEEILETNYTVADNLAMNLVYDGFAAESKAYKFVNLILS